MTTDGPLAGVRVLGIATFIAAPFCGTVLGEFGTPSACGDTFVRLSEGRNMESATQDLRSTKGANIFRKLVAKPDVVLENFRPGTLEKWRLGYEALSVVLSV
jgi:crotonobetainyl-CoA:carnitine CoA-transferase CaiB-like acyl-CoA transferase